MSSILLSLAKRKYRIIISIVARKVKLKRVLLLQFLGEYSVTILGLQYRRKDGIIKGEQKFGTSVLGMERKDHGTHALFIQ